MKCSKKESGFTLIEVVASIVIITIVLLSFSQLFIQSNKTAAYNNEKLVLINLAHAELERFQSNPIKATSSDLDKIDKPPETSPKCPRKITELNASTAAPTESSNLCYSSSAQKNLRLNDRDYKVSIDAKQYENDKKLNLINIKVTVHSTVNSNSKSTVEGYVEYVQ